MGRAAKIAAVAVMGGLLMTLAILHLSSPPAPDASPPNRIAADASAAVTGRPVTAAAVTTPNTTTNTNTEAIQGRRRRCRVGGANCGGGPACIPDQGGVDPGGDD